MARDESREALDERIGPQGSALFSRDHHRRFRLTRRLASGPPERVALFLMLNPALADENKADGSIRRCVGYATREGATRLIVVNLFAHISKDPLALRPFAGTPAPQNAAIIGAALADMQRAGGFFVCAWGSAPVARARAASLAPLWRAPGVTPLCLGTNRDGAPSHPLYLPANRPLRPWDGRAYFGG